MLLVDKKTGEVKVTIFSKFMHDTIGRDPGSMIIQNHEFSWDDETRDFIVVDGGKEDRQAYIDSFADDCGVYNVLKKYSRTGDLSLLQRGEGQYLDISNLPVDELNPAKLAEAAQSSVNDLSKKLGVSITSEQLASMSLDEINDLIAKAVSARVDKSSDTTTKEGE